MPVLELLVDILGPSILDSPTLPAALSRHALPYERGVGPAGEIDSETCCMVIAIEGNANNPCCFSGPIVQHEDPCTCGA